MTSCTIFVLVSALIAVNQAAKLPESFQRCDFKKNVNECWAKAIPAAIAHLTKPYKSLGLPSLNPLELPELKIGAGSGPVKVDQNFFDVKLFGLNDIEISNLDLNFEKKTLVFDLFLKEVTLKANYDLNGQILLLPIQGKGPSTVVLHKMKGSGDETFEIVEKNGEKHLKMLTCNVKLEPEKVSFNFENLFNGDKALGDNINKVLNENDKEVFADVKSGYETVIAKIILGLSNEIYSRVPLKELFANYE